MAEVLNLSIELKSQQGPGHDRPDEDIEPHLEASRKPLKV